MMVTHEFFAVLPPDARLIRQEIFVREQGFRNEFDEVDNNCTHLVVYVDGVPAAVGRLYPDGDKVYALGRIAVRKQYRGTGLGGTVITLLEDKARELGAEKAVLSAQCRVREFYEKQDYTAFGDTYLDEFCEHIRMEKIL